MLIEFKSQLDAIDPRLWWVVIALVVYGLVFAWKKIHPASFEKVPARFKALPAAILGAIMAATAADEIPKMLFDLVMGVISGVTAVGGHEAGVRLLTGKGSGASKEPKNDKKSPAGSG